MNIFDPFPNKQDGGNGRLFDHDGVGVIDVMVATADGGPRNA